MKVIIEDEQENSERAEYGKKFYLKYQKFQTMSGKLSWSHYCEILSISDDKERAFYEENGIYSEYALGGLSNQIFASKYTLFLMRKFLKMRWKKF